MRFLICGLGSIGRRHLRNLRSLGQEDIVLLRTRQGTLPDDDFVAGLPVEAAIEEALTRWTPEAVIVANPTSRHLEIAIPAAKAGCHLLIEKPVSDSMDRIDDLRTAVAHGGGQVLVGFQFRFHPGLRKAKELLEHGAIGRAVSARVEWGEYLPGWHSWEDYHAGYSARKDLGGGVLLTLCHPFDYLRWLLGDVKEVRATVGKLGDLGIDVEDTAEVILTHAGGPVSSIHLDYLRRPACHRMEVTGTEGCLRWDDEDGAVRWWSASDPVWRRYSPPEGFERNTMFQEEMRDFVNTVAGNTQPVCSLLDGIRALQMVVACKQSSMEGGCIGIPA